VSFLFLSQICVVQIHGWPTPHTQFVWDHSHTYGSGAYLLEGSSGKRHSDTFVVDVA